MRIENNNLTCINIPLIKNRWRKYLHLSTLRYKWYKNCLCEKYEQLQRYKCILLFVIFKDDGECECHKCL